MTRDFISSADWRNIAGSLSRGTDISIAVPAEQRYVQEYRPGDMRMPSPFQYFVTVCDIGPGRIGRNLAKLVEERDELRERVRVLEAALDKVKQAMSV